MYLENSSNNNCSTKAKKDVNIYQLGTFNIQFRLYTCLAIERKEKYLHVAYTTCSYYK